MTTIANDGAQQRPVTIEEQIAQAVGCARRLPELSLYISRESDALLVGVHSLPRAMFDALAAEADVSRGVATIGVHGVYDVARFTRDGVLINLFSVCYAPAVEPATPEAA